VNSDRSFRNADLEKYKGDVNGVIIPETTLQHLSRKRRRQRKEDEKSKQYWCSRGSAIKAKVDRSKAMSKPQNKSLLT